MADERSDAADTFQPPDTPNPADDPKPSNIPKPVDADLPSNAPEPSGASIPSHWLTLEGKRINAIQESPRPVVVRKEDHPAGYYTPMHSHDRGQLLFVIEGVMQVSTRYTGFWVVPPQRAVWIPPYIEHDAKSVQPVMMRNVYLSEQAARGLPESCQVITVTPLLRELLLTLSDYDRLYDEAGAEGRLIQVFLDQVRAIPGAPLHLPQPASTQLRRIATALRDEPADQRSMEDWADQLGLSSRTLARRFRQETGLTFGQWRQQARLLAAVTRIAQGDAVVRVAQELGYESQSAFISMFRKALGKTPGRYFSDQ